MITFSNTGISTIPTKSGRTLVYTDIVINSGSSGTSGSSGSIGNDETYHWAVYVPPLIDQTLGEYLEAHASEYEADILEKEAYWETIPHTEEITDPLTGVQVIVDIPKERIVCATVPDYIESASSVDSDIAAIKRLLQVLTTAVTASSTITAQQIKDLATIYDYWEIGKPYLVGKCVDYKGTPYKVIQAHTSQIDWTPDKVPALFTVISTSPNWTAGVAYLKDAIVIYGGSSYKCLQAHTAQVGWEPPNVPALWQIN